MQKYLLIVLFYSMQAFSQTPRIVNGQPASIQIYPWIVNYRNCSGTLIAPQWVLTAAHCFSDFDPNAVPTLMLGSNNNINLETAAISARAIQIIPHPEYQNYHNDLALIKLAEPINTVPIVTLRAEPNIPDDSKLLTLGWGATAEDSQGEPIQFSPTLLQTRLAIKNNGFCSRHFGPGISDNLLCAAGLNPRIGTDTCRGDSGGPLLMESEGGFVQIGITSFGATPCGQPDVPSVYTRISQFQSWIKIYVREAKFDNDYQPEFPAACQTSANAQLTLDIPCLHYQNQIYHIQLAKNSKLPLTWQLNNNYAASDCPMNQHYCAVIDDKLNLQLHGIPLNQHSYQLRFQHDADKNRHFWTYETQLPE